MSSSEPDSVVSPLVDEQIASNGDFDSQNSEFNRFLSTNEEITPFYAPYSEIDYPINQMKSNDLKIRRMQAPMKITRQSGTAQQQQITYKVMPDSHGNLLHFHYSNSFFFFYFSYLFPQKHVFHFNHFITSLVTVINLHAFFFVLINNNKFIKFII